MRTSTRSATRSSTSTTASAYGGRNADDERNAYVDEDRNAGLERRAQRRVDDGTRKLERSRVAPSAGAAGRRAHRARVKLASRRAWLASLQSMP